MVNESNIVLDAAIICVLLIIGTLVRHRIGWLQRFVIPASVIGGIVGLILGEGGVRLLPTHGFNQYAGILIDVIFAGLFIGRPIPPFRQLVRTAGAQTAFVYINAFGQIAIGLLVVLAFNAMGFALHPTFGISLIIGYQGGPGVATAVAPMFQKLGWAGAEAAAVGETVAVAGLVLAVFVGMVMVNIGIARNLTIKKFDHQGERVTSPTFLPSDQAGIVGREITSPEAASSLAFNFGFMGLAILLGKLIVMGIVYLAPVLEFLPSFPFVLIGGLVVQLLIQRLGLTRFVDRESVGSITGFTLDVLIVASLAAVNIAAVASHALPILALIVIGLIFNLWMVVSLAPRMLPGAWFEKGLCEFGQNTGSVPQALLLLRMADPRFDTDAAEALALKMFLFSPIVFPSTMILLPFLVSKGPLVFVIGYVLAMLAVLVLARIVFWQKRSSIKWFGETTN